MAEIERIHRFLEEYVDLIDSNNFTELYEHAELHFLAKRLDDSIAQLTLLLNSIDIDPLKYMTEMPQFYIGHVEGITEFKIPDHIIKFKSNALSACYDLKTIEIPYGTLKLSDGIFSFCRSLTEVTLPNTIKEIKDVAFYMCTNIDTIIYKGTIDEWNSIKKYKYWKDATCNYNVKCTDGVIRV